MSVREQKNVWNQEYMRLKKEFELTFNQIPYAYISEDVNQELVSVEKLEKDYITSIKRSIQKIQRSVKEFQQGLRKGNVKQELNSIENNLTSFKSHMKCEYEMLLIESEQLEKEIISFDSSIQDYAIVTPIPASTGGEKRSTQQLQKIVDSDIETRQKLGLIDRKLALLGRYGGWDIKDHDAFLRIWTQLGCKFDENALLGSTQFLFDAKIDKVVETMEVAISSIDLVQYEPLVVKVNRLLGTLNTPEIEQHVIWYLTTLGLQYIKKSLLSNWKSIKDFHRNQRMDAVMKEVENSTLGPPSNDKSDSASNEKEKLESFDERETKRKAVQDKVKRWKMEKAEELARKQAEEAQEQLDRERRIASEKLDRQRNNRMEIEKWKEVKQKNEQLEIEKKQESLSKRPQSADPAELRRRQERDLNLAKQKVEKIEAKKKEQTRRQDVQKAFEEKISLVIGSSISKDPSRARSNTRASMGQALTRESLDDMSSRRQNASAHNAAMPMSARDIRGGVRAAPIWCRKANF